MKEKSYLRLFVGIGLIALLTVASCAPQSQPNPPVSPSPSPPKAQLPLPAVVSPGTSTDSWAKVVEAAKREGRLTIYSFNFIGELGIMLQRAFKQRYGIELEIITGRGAEFVERLKMERRLGKVVADTTHCG